MGAINKPKEETERLVGFLDLNLDTKKAFGGKKGKRSKKQTWQGQQYANILNQI